MRPLFLVALIASISLAYVACGSPTPTQEAGQEPASETITDASIETPPDASEKAPESPAVEQGPEVTAQNCEMGKFYPCYSGDPALAGKGICRTGSRKCLGDGTWGACNGAVGPGRETGECDGKDNDCDGEVDEGCSLPPGRPRIVEVMVNPLHGDTWFIEVQNTSKDQHMLPCDWEISGKEPFPKYRKAVPQEGDKCPAIKPGGRVVIAGFRGLNVYKIPADSALLLAGGVLSTGDDGSFSHFRLRYKGTIFEELAAQGVTGDGKWPKDGVVMEKCDATGGNNSGNWKENTSGGTPGKINAAVCP